MIILGNEIVKGNKTEQSIFGEGKYPSNAKITPASTVSPPPLFSTSRNPSFEYWLVSRFTSSDVPPAAPKGGGSVTGPKESRLFLLSHKHVYFCPFSPSKLIWHGVSLRDASTFRR